MTNHIPVALRRLEQIKASKTVTSMPSEKSFKVELVDCNDNIRMNIHWLTNWLLKKFFLLQLPGDT